MTHFDLAIIGTGSGNSILTEAYESLSVAIVERGVFGGTCLNVGCIPSKMFIYAAEVAHLAQDVGPTLGVRTDFVGADWTAIRDRIFGRIDPIAAGGEHYRAVEQDHVTVFKGSGRFVTDKTLAIDMVGGGVETITADRFVLAAGARPFVPEVFHGIHAAHTSDTIMRIDAIPERLVVIGGGYIGAELGHVFGAFGAQVTFVLRGDQMLRQEDPDISMRFTDAYARRFDVRRNTSVVAVENRPDGGAVLTVRDGDGDHEIETDLILVATGRIPNGDQLDLHNVGVELDSDGYVVVDEHLQTTNPDIVALGDLTNPAQLKHTANADARVISHNLLHPDDRVTIDRALTPSAVFGSPQVASVGMTEPEANRCGRPLSVVVHPYGATAYGWAMEDTTSACKLIADTETRELLGAHIVGPQASTLIQQLIQGMVFGQTVDEMASGQLYIHPALSEVVEQALLEL